MKAKLKAADVRNRTLDDDITTLKSDNSYFIKCFNDRKATDSTILRLFRDFHALNFAVLAQKEEVDVIVQCWYGVLGVRLQERGCFGALNLTVALTGLIALKIHDRNETHCVDVNHVYRAGW